MKKKREFSLNIGLPSIILIFIILCLVSFGVLSLVSANADRKLSQKVLDRSSAYYNACNEAEEMLFKVDYLLHDRYNNSSSREEYISSISDIQAVYVYQISDIQYLEVSLSFLYPDTKGSPLYQIMSWQVKTKDDLDYDTNLHLIEIEDIE